jgi:vacuolar-type H+-ATPase subunit H
MCGGDMKEVIERILKAEQDAKRMAQEAREEARRITDGAREEASYG